VEGLVDFEFKEKVSYPVDRVYQALRDRLVELPPFLPEIDSIEQHAREDRDDGGLYVNNVWQGNAKSAPRAVRPFVSRKMLAWRDLGTWYEDPKRVEWVFETMHFDALFTCSGTNFFEAAGDDATQIRLTGSLQVYPERLPGVPRILARRVGPAVEKWLMNMVTPNLARLPRAIQALLDSDG
jgi:hypothetical protein